MQSLLPSLLLAAAAAVLCGHASVLLVLNPPDVIPMTLNVLEGDDACNDDGHSHLAKNKNGTLYIQPSAEQSLHQGNNAFEEDAKFVEFASRAKTLYQLEDRRFMENFFERIKESCCSHLVNYEVKSLVSDYLAKVAETKEVSDELSDGQLHAIRVHLNTLFSLYKLP